METQLQHLQKTEFSSYQLSMGKCPPYPNPHGSLFMLDVVVIFIYRLHLLINDPTKISRVHPYKSVLREIYIVKESPL